MHFQVLIFSIHIGLSWCNIIVSWGACVYNGLGRSYENKTKFVKNYNRYWGRLAEKSVRDEPQAPYLKKRNPNKRSRRIFSFNWKDITFFPCEVPHATRLLNRELHLRENKIFPWCLDKQRNKWDREDLAQSHVVFPQNFSS